MAFGQLEAPLTRLFDTKTGYYAAADSEQTIDKLLSSKAVNELKKINLSPVLPPEVKAKRTITIRQLDQSVGEHSAKEIITEITKQNKNIKLSEVIKIKDYTHVIKVVCDSVETADQILTNGLLAFNTRITQHQCEREVFTYLQTCFRCYKIESHNTNECKQDFVICSECGERGHTFKACTSSNKKCINCPEGNNDHRTMAMKCPVRKAAIAAKNKEKQNQKTVTENKTYAAIAKQAAEATTKENKPRQINVSGMQIKMAAIILEAHVAAIGENKSFGKILSASLKENYNIDATFPDRNSKRIFNLYVLGQDHEHDDMVEPEDDMEFEEDNDFLGSSFNLSEPVEVTTNMGPPPTKPKKPSPKKSPKKHHRSSSASRAPPQRTESSERKRKAAEDLSMENSVWSESRITSELDTTKHKYDAEDLGLKLFKSQLDKSPIPRVLSGDYLKEKFAQEDFGLKFEARRGTPQSIIDMLSTGQILVMNKDVEAVSHDKFKKMADHCILPPTKKQRQHSHGSEK